MESLEIHISIAAETLFMLGPVPVTNSMLTMFIVMGLLLIAGAAMARGAKLVPGRWQSLFEVSASFILDLVESTGGKSFGRRVFPMIGAIFIFIAIANYSGLLPGVGTIGFYRTEEVEHEEEAGPSEATETDVAEPAPVAVEVTDEGAEEEAHEVLVPLFRAPTADINMTLAMALVTFTTVQVAGIRAHGVVGRIKHMADPPFLFPIELVSELGRIISLSARLFGNIFAGEVLLAVMYALANALFIVIVPLLVPVVFIFLELLFGTIQALVFALLTAIYITMAAVDTHGGEHAEHPPEERHGSESATVARAPAAAGD